jgi:uncharacterized phage infection (PIP) family protein YhgE
MNAMIEDQQLHAIETQLNQAQVQLESYESKLPDGDEAIRRVQNVIDSLWALYDGARKNPGLHTPDEFADGVKQLDAEMAQVAARSQGAAQS